MEEATCTRNYNIHQGSTIMYYNKSVHEAAVFLLSNMHKMCTYMYNIMHDLYYHTYSCTGTVTTRKGDVENVRDALQQIVVCLFTAKIGGNLVVLGTRKRVVNREDAFFSRPKR